MMIYILKSNWRLKIISVDVNYKKKIDSQMHMFAGLKISEAF